MRIVQPPRPQYVFVLCCLVALLVLPAVASAFAASGRAISLVGLLVPVLAVAAASETRRHRRTAIILAFVCAVTNAEGLVHFTSLPSEVGAATALVFLAYTSYLLMNGVLRSRRVTSDVIAGALASYLMIGLTWAFAYGLVEMVAPGSISTPAGRRLDLQTLIYFSYITLMTIGYGDVTPAAPAARALAIFEGLVGVAFTTIVLAALVAMLLRGKGEE
jgi:hypothetical protein